MKNYKDSYNNISLFFEKISRQTIKVEKFEQKNYLDSI